MLTKVRMIKVTKNEQGNYRGIIGKGIVKFFGTAEYDALYWLQRALEQGGFVISQSSYFSKEDVLNHAKKYK